MEKNIKKYYPFEERKTGKITWIICGENRRAIFDRKKLVCFGKSFLGEYSPEIRQHFEDAGYIVIEQ